MKFLQKKTFINICFGLLAVVPVILFIKMPVNAAEKVIRVGYPIQDNMTEMDEDGKRSGYSYEYLMEIARYQGWTYEFVQADGTLDEQMMTLLDMMQKGEIDLCSGLNYSEGLAEIYDYPGNNYGTAYYTLCSLDKNTELNSSNFYIRPELKVAVFSSKRSPNEKLEQYAQMSGFTATQVFCNSEKEQMRLLETGQVDAILTKDIAMPSDHLVTLASFSPSPFYFATTKGNKEVVNGLDHAMSAIQRDNPYFSTNLWNKYFAQITKELYFSEEQKKYLENADVIKAAVLCGRPPIQYRDSVTGEAKGVSLKLLDFISEQTGLRFEVHAADSIEEYKKLILDGKMDIALGVSDELVEYGWQKMRVTMPFLESPIVLALTRSINPQELEGKKLAMAEGFKYGGKYKGNVSYFETAEACLEAVHAGEADYCYANNYTAQYYMSHPDSKNLILIPQPDAWTLKYSIGIVQKDDEILLGIFNKAVEYFVTQDLIKNYLYENAYKQEEVTFSSYLHSNPMEAALILILFILILVFAVMVIWQLKERRYRLIRRVENDRYEQISEISNEYLFEYNSIEDSLKLSEKCALFLDMPRRVDNASRLRQEKEFINDLLSMETQTEERQIPRTDGSMQWIRTTTKWIKDSKGEKIFLVGKLTDIQAEKNEEQRLRRKAEKDFLTGVYNMSTFREKISEFYKNTDNPKYVFYIIDIDNFKAINDTYGHFIGDVVLEEIGTILRETFKKNRNMAGRLGGDEFVVQSVYDGSDEEIARTCRSLMAKVGEIDFPGKNTEITISIGVVVLDAGEDFDKIYKQADAALYEVKNRGRNGYHIRASKTEEP